MRNRLVCALFAAMWVGFGSNAVAQMLDQPRIYQRPAGQAAAAERTAEKPDIFASTGFVLPLDGSLFSASAQVVTLAIAPFKSSCQAATGRLETCVEKPLFKLTIDTHVVQSLATQVDSVREYMLSRRGSPGSVTFPFLRWSTKSPDVKQFSWFGVEPFGSLRWVPLSESKNNYSASLGGSAQLAFAVTATAQDPVQNPTNPEVSYPGTIYFAVTPSFAKPIGDDLKNLVFAGISDPSSYVFGVEIRAGFQFKGENPISLSFSGTLGRKGFEGSTNSVGLSFSKLFGHKAAAAGS